MCDRNITNQLSAGLCFCFVLLCHKIAKNLFIIINQMCRPKSLMQIFFGQSWIYLEMIIGQWRNEEKKLNVKVFFYDQFIKVDNNQLVLPRKVENHHHFQTGRQYTCSLCMHMTTSKKFWWIWFKCTTTICKCKSVVCWVPFFFFLL